MEYNEFRYLFPPRPETPVAPHLIKTFEEGKYLAQAKKNGTCNIIAVSPDKKIFPMTRHNTKHRAWQPMIEMGKTFNHLPDNWFVFVAELMHSKVEGLRHINYIHDILVDNGNYLIGKSNQDRQSILDRCFHSKDETPTHLIIDEFTWRAKNYYSNFDILYESLKSENQYKGENEGIVLKSLTQRLHPCVKETSNVAGLFKCRYTKASYTF